MEDVVPGSRYEEAKAALKDIITDCLLYQGNSLQPEPTKPGFCYISGAYTKYIGWKVTVDEGGDKTIYRISDFDIEKIKSELKSDLGFSAVEIKY